MRMRTVFLTAVLVATVGVVPAASRAAKAATYAATGTLRVAPKGPAGSGTWAMDGSLRLTREVGAGAPSSGTLSAWGKIGMASVQGLMQPCVFTATTGKFSVSWSNGEVSKGTAIHLMTHPRHTLVGVVTAGYLKGSSFMMIFRHRANGAYSGDLILSP